MTLQEINLIYNTTKYGVLYIKIVQKAIHENRTKLKKDNLLYVYYEAHHILPRSLYPNYAIFKNNKWNKILLTAKEHFICHILLMKHYRKINNRNGYIKMSKAIKILSKNYSKNSKKYEQYKLNLSHSEETKLKIGRANKGRIIGPWSSSHREYMDKNPYTHSEETKLKIGRASKGRTMSEENKQLISKRFSEPHTDKHKKNLSKNWNKEAKRNSKIIQIFNEHKKLIFTSSTNFALFCSDNNLPFGMFVKSYKNNGEPLYINSTNSVKGKANKKGYLKFTGWYAKLS